MKTDAITVVVVDSEVSTADTSASHLESESDRITCLTEQSVSEGLACLDKATVDCIISDYQFPERDGLDFLGIVREMYPDLPFVLFTHDGSERVAEAAIEAGVTSYKRREDGPAQYADLATRICTHVDQYWDRSQAHDGDSEYELIAEGATDVFWTVDPATETISFSDGLDHFGYSSVDVPTDLDWLFDRLNPDDRDRVREHYDALLACEERAFDELSVDRGTFTNEFRFQRTDGTYADCFSRGIVEFEDGDPVKMVGTMSDVTERKRRIRQLEQIRRHVSDVIWMSDPNKDSMEFISNSYEDVWGRSPESLRDEPMSFVDAVHPDDRQQVEQALAAQQERPDQYEETYRIVRPDGEIRWIHDRSSGVYEEGTLTRIVGVASDITERKKREQELSETRDRMELALETTDAAVWDMDFDSCDVNFYPSSQTLYDADIDTLDDFLNQIHTDDRQRVEAALDTGTETGSYKAEFRIMTDEGVRWVADTGHISCTDDGAPDRGTGVVRDITERKERERELAYRKALLEAQAETTVDGLLLVDPERNVKYYNERVLDQWDIPESVAGDRSNETFLECIHERFTDPDQCQKMVESLNDQPGTEHRDTVELADGRWFDRYSAPVVADGTHYGRLWVFRDITEQKESELTLRQQRDNLAQLNRLNTMAREIMQALQNTATRDDLERAVCDRLTASNLYQTAWIGVREDVQSERLAVSPQTAAGVDEAYLDGISEHEGPASVALRTDETHVINNVQTADAFPDARRELALAYDHYAIATVPLTAGETVQGVLAVYAPEGHTIEEAEREILTDLGRIIGLAIQRANSQRSLTAETAIALQLRVPQADAVVGEVTADRNLEVVYERFVPLSDGRGLQYVTVHGAEPDAVCSHLNEASFVDTCTVVQETDGDRGDGTLVEVRIEDRSQTVVSVLVERGASITTARATDGDIYIDVEIPPEHDIRELVTAVREVAPAAEIDSKRLVDRQVTTVPDIQQQISDQLTPRQLAAIGTAYSRGYYDWPRESTAEELADSMDISSATLHYHMRHALQKLLTAFFDQPCLDEHSTGTPTRIDDRDSQ